MKPPKQNSALCNYKASDFYREAGVVDVAAYHHTDFTTYIYRFGPCSFSDTFSATLWLTVG
jgi:hypothetical protein